MRRRVVLRALTLAVGVAVGVAGNPSTGAPVKALVFSIIEKGQPPSIPVKSQPWLRHDRGPVLGSDEPRHKDLTSF